MVECGEIECAAESRAQRERRYYIYLKSRKRVILKTNLDVAAAWAYRQVFQKSSRQHLIKLVSNGDSGVFFALLDLASAPHCP